MGLVLAKSAKTNGLSEPAYFGRHIGTLVHTIDIARGGWLPYRYAPFGANLFWSLLAILDPAVVVLLICRRRLGLALAVTIMVPDVAVNSYMAYALPIDKLPRFLALQLPTLFCGFVLGSVAFLWRASSRPPREAVAAGHVQEAIREGGISPGEAQRGFPDGL
jgi:hypothetical protein